MKQSVFLKNIACVLCALAVALTFSANAQDKSKIKMRRSTTTSTTTTSSSSSSKATTSSSSSSSTHHNSSKSKTSTKAEKTSKSSKKNSTNKKKSSTKRHHSTRDVEEDYPVARQQAQQQKPQQQKQRTTTARNSYLDDALKPVEAEAAEKSGYYEKESQKDIDYGYDSKSNEAIYKGGSTTLSLSTTNLTFDASGGTQYINVSSNRDWYVGTVPTSWGHYTKSGNQLTFTADRNYNRSSRNDYFTIVAGDKCMTVTVNQNGKIPTLSLSSESLSVSALGETRFITVYSDGEPWSIIGQQPSWVNVSTNGDKLTVEIIANTSNDRRADYLTLRSGVNTKYLKIIQEGLSSYGSSKSSYSSSSSQNSYDDIYSTSTSNSTKYNYSTYTGNGESWFKGRFSIGIELFVDAVVRMSSGSDKGKINTFTYGAGLNFRLGKFSDLLNFSLGAKWMGVGVSGDDYYSDSNYANYFVIPGYLKFNLIRLGKKAKLYVGGGFEYGLELKTADKYMAWNTGLGINSRHVDWYLYFKQYLECGGDRLFNFDDGNNNHLGTSLTFYF